MWVKFNIYMGVWMQDFDFLRPMERTLAWVPEIAAGVQGGA